MDLAPVFEFGKQIELQSVQVFPVIIGIILTLIQCFFGFKLLRYLIAFWGFALFGFVGYNMGTLFDQQTVGIVICLAFGALGGFIAYKYYKAGVFLQGFVAGFIGGLMIGVFSKWSVGLVISAAIVIGILIGLLTYYLLKPMVILTSGFSGGMSSGAALSSLFGFAPSVVVFVGAILSIIGIIYQFIGGKGKDKRDDKCNDNKLDKDKPVTAVENAFINISDDSVRLETDDVSTEILPSSEKDDDIAES